MLVKVNTDNHIRGGDELVTDVEGALQNALERFDPQITRVEVHLADLNSHKKGDNDKRCALEARLAGMQPVAAVATGGDINQAVAAAIDKLISQLDRKLGRLGDVKSRTSFGGEPIE